MGCLGMLVDLFGLEVVLEAIWNWLKSCSWRRGQDDSKRKK